MPQTYEELLALEIGAIQPKALLGNLEQFLLFEENKCWKDIKGFITTKIARLNKQIIVEDDINKIMRMQGQLLELRAIFALPSIITKSLKEDENVRTKSTSTTKRS